MLIKDSYQFKTLVFVNSAGHAYTELPIDRHSLLVGANNIGKTSSLSALKLFLLPEVDFTDTPRKFDFRSSASVYDSLDSFQYYFPCNQSFIVLAVENPHGPFCVILSRGSGELSYARTFVPQPFDAIRPLFWEHDEGSIGKPNVALTREGLKAALKSEQPLYVNDRGNLKEAIYNERPLDPRMGRYCMVPLPDGGSKLEVQALRSLVHLLFDSSEAVGRGLPHAIATIIEGERQSAGERLAVDFDALLMEHEALYTESQRLDRLEDHLPLWRQLDEASLKHLQQSRQAAALYRGLQRGYEAVEASLRPQVESWETDRQRLYAEQARLKGQHERLAADHHRQEGELRGLQKAVNGLQKAVDAAEGVLRDYPGTMLPVEVVEALKAQQAEHQEAIKRASDQQHTQQRLAEALAERKELTDRIGQIQSALATADKATLGRLSAAGASVLKSLNRDLARSRAALSDEQIVTAEAFAHQFRQEMGQLAWGDDPLAGTTYIEYDPALELARLKDELDDRTRSLTKVERDVSELNGLLKKTESQKANFMEEQKQALQRAERDAQFVEALPFRRRELAEKQDEVAQIEGRVAEAKRLADAAANDMAAVSGKLTEAQARVNDISSRLDDLRRHMERAVMASGNLATESADEPGGDAIQPVSETGFAVAVDQYRDLCEEAERQRRAALQALRQLIRHELVEGIPKTEADRDDIGPDEVRRYRDRFSAEFTNVAGLRKNHYNRIFEHNKSTSAMVSELKVNVHRIDSFTKEINEELKAHRISNLTAKIRIALDPRFVDLKEKFDQRQPHMGENELADKSFYQDIESFSKDFFHKRGQHTVLNLQDVISQVDFVFDKDSVAMRKTQSTGTTSMFFAVLLSALFNRLIAGGSQLHMPLVMDEVANLDADNLSTLLEVADQHGFALFSATPELSGLLASLIGHWITLGRLQVDNPLAPECTCVWLDGHETLTSLEEVA